MKLFRVFPILFFFVSPLYAEEVSIILETELKREVSCVFSCRETGFGTDLYVSKRNLPFGERFDDAAKKKVRRLWRKLRRRGLSRGQIRRRAKRLKLKQIKDKNELMMQCEAHAATHPVLRDKTACGSDNNKNTPSEGIAESEIIPSPTEGGEITEGGEGESRNDKDGDGVSNEKDNCVVVFNPEQRDCDKDFIGDLCDAESPCSSDEDGDGVVDSVDNCPSVFNPDQSDSNNNGIGDACDEPEGDEIICQGNVCGCGEYTVPTPLELVQYLRTETEKLMVAGASGIDKDVFSFFNPNGNNSVYNQDAWFSSFDLTGAAHHNNPSATAVTKRHVISTKHAGYHPNVGTVLKFFAKDGTKHERSVIDTKSSYGDIWISYLDEDLPDTIATYPILPPETWDQHLQLASPSAPNYAPIIAETNNKKIGYKLHATSFLNGVMSLSTWSSGFVYGDYVSYFTPLNTGSSTRPFWMIFDSQLVFLFPATTPSSGTWISNVNAFNAVSQDMALLDQRNADTGYTLELFDLEGFSRSKCSCNC